MFKITSDLFGNGGDVTVSEMNDMISDWPDDYEGWEFEVEERGNQLRIYCNRADSEDRTPSLYTDWIMTTPDTGYIVVGESIEE